MPERVLGPVLRHLEPSDATIWIETDSPCVAEVRAGGAFGRSRTFRVGAHHYALVHVTGLAPGVSHEYEVRLDPAGHARGVTWRNTSRGNNAASSR
jgi:hypothetical protein